MQNSAKHLIAVLAVFIAYTASVYITQAYNTEAAAVLSTIYTLSFSAVLAAVCIIIAIRHQKQRRYFLSLSMIMLCFCFAELYIGIHTLVKEAAASFIITLPITELSYLGATAFMAAFCARIWYEEIPKTEIKPGKSILASAVAVLLFLIRTNRHLRRISPHNRHTLCTIRRSSSLVRSQILHHTKNRKTIFTPHGSYNSVSYNRHALDIHHLSDTCHT